MPLDDYRAILGSEYNALELEPESSRFGFRAHFSTIDLGVLRIFNTFTNSSHCIKNHRGKALSDDNRFVLTLLEKGYYEVHQMAGTVGCSPNQLVLLDSGANFETHQTGAARTVSISMPKKCVYSLFARADRVCGKVLNTNSGCGALLLKMVSSINDNKGNLSNHYSHNLVSSLSAIMSAAYLEVRSEEQCQTGTSQHFFRILACIDEHFFESNLNAYTVAAQLDLSRSYVNAIAARHHTTIGKLILTKRLKEAHKLLSSPQHLTGQITEIAFNMGFQSLSHFSRSFNERYGVAPSRFRNIQTEN